MLSYISLLQQHPTSSSCRTALPEQFDVTFEALPGSIQHKSPHRHNSAKVATACASTRRIKSPAELAQQLLCTGKAPVEQARSSLDTANHNRRWQLLPHHDLSSQRLHLETPDDLIHMHVTWLCMRQGICQTKRVWDEGQTSLLPTTTK